MLIDTYVFTVLRRRLVAYILNLLPKLAQLKLNHLLAIPGPKDVKNMVIKIRTSVIKGKKKETTTPEITSALFRGT